MNTIKMIAELKTTCSTLNSEKNELMDRVKFIDDRLAWYKMAIDSLSNTLSESEQPKTVVPETPVKPGKYHMSSVIEFNGKRQSLSKWAKEIGITAQCLYYRLNKGWSVNDALTKPRDTSKLSHKAWGKMKVFKYDPRGNVIRQYTGVADAARTMRLPKTTVEKILTLSKEDQLKSHPDYYIAYAK